jgi:hypothetical protein
MTCHCIAKVNKALAEQGASLVLPLALVKGPRPRMLIRAEQDKTHKVVNLFATFCPVCGKKYDPEPVRPADPLGKTREKTVKKLGKERRKLRPPICPKCKGKFQAIVGKTARCDACGYWYQWDSAMMMWKKSVKATPPSNLVRVEDD